MNLKEKFKAWNRKRLENSEHYEFAFVALNSIAANVVMQAIKEFDIPYKTRDLRVFVCQNCARNKRFPDFLKAITERYTWAAWNVYSLTKLTRIMVSV